MEIPAACRHIRNCAPNDSATGPPSDSLPLLSRSTSVTGPPGHYLLREARTFVGDQPSHGWPSVVGGGGGGVWLEPPSAAADPVALIIGAPMATETANAIAAILAVVRDMDITKSPIQWS